MCHRTTLQRSAVSRLKKVWRTLGVDRRDGQVRLCLTVTDPAAIPLFRFVLEDD
jgi:hypothetical protein